MKRQRWIWAAGLLTLGIMLGCEVEPEDNSDEAHAYEWATSTPAEQGLNAQRLNSIEGAAKDTRYVDSFLIIRHGLLVWESYFMDMRETTQHPLQSVTKSILGALIGMAIDNGLIDNLDQKVMTFFPEYQARTTDSRWEDVTIQHLLDMTAGVITGKGSDQGDAILNIVRLPLLCDPGTEFNYSDLGAHLLSILLTKLNNGRTAATYARLSFCPTLGIEIPTWYQDDYGYSGGGAGIEMTPRDMARIGYLYLLGGSIDGTQIFSEAWADEVVNMPVGEGSWGELTEVAYHNLWWSGKIGEEKAFLAIGYGGQMIIGFPELDMLVVATCEIPDKEDESETHYAKIFQLIQQYVLPAVID